MRIVVITQDEPFYLTKNFNYLIRILPKSSLVVGCVVSDVSPFGKKENLLEKAKKTYKVFGLSFFLHYSSRFIQSRILGRNSIRRFLKDRNIPEINLSKNINHPDSVQAIQKLCPDLLISILGNQIFKEPIINLAPKGCLNLHTALLPRYRGLMPTFWVLKNNEKYTGVSVFYVDKGIDSGPIIVQKKIEIGERSQEELIKYTKRIGMEAIAEAVDLIEKDQVTVIENNAKEKTYYSFPTREDVKVFKQNGKQFF